MRRVLERAARSRSHLDQPLQPADGRRKSGAIVSGDRERVARELPPLGAKYPKLLIPEGMARAFVSPPSNPQSCVFSRMSVNYSADLESRVEPCVFGGNPDCSQCGCSISSALHWIQGERIAGPLRVGHLVNASLSIGAAVNRCAAAASGLRAAGNREHAPPGHALPLCRSNLQSEPDV